MAQRDVMPDHGQEGGWLVTDNANRVRIHTSTQVGVIEHAQDELRQQGGGTLFVHTP